MAPSGSDCPAQRRTGRIAERGGGLQGGLSGATDRATKKGEEPALWQIPLLPDRSAKTGPVPWRIPSLPGTPDASRLGQPIMSVPCLFPIETVARATKPCTSSVDVVAPSVLDDQARGSGRL